MKHTLPQNVNVQFMACCGDCDISTIVTTETELTTPYGYSIDAFEITCEHIDACARMKNIAKNGKE